jgi:DNA-binding transcriptional MerR regulator
MKMQKRKFRIGELADKLELERFVVRFWEKEFSIKTKRSQGSQRFYDENDLKKFETIKRLLYEEGFTISGAKKKLKDKSSAKEKYLSQNESIIASQKTTMEEPKKAANQSENEKIEHLSQQIVDLKDKLRKLREML